MLRPEQMSRVSVVGSKPVMDDTIEAIHDLELVHLSNYDGSWEGFESGDPTEGAESAAEKLVTVRSLESILDVSPDDAGATRVITDDQLEEELERVRERANELDDRRSELEERLREVEEQLDAMDPFVALGIDLDLLGGYDSLDVLVGPGDTRAVETALQTAEAVREFETFLGDDDRTVAAFARLAEGTDESLSDVVVGVEFEEIPAPDAEGPPQDHVERLRDEKRRLESELETVESEIETLRVDAAGFLLAAEEQLAIEVQKTEAPLRFATTENGFVAEGWIPTERVDDLQGALDAAVGDHVQLDELERANYTEDGHPEEPEPVEDRDRGVGEGEPEPVATDGGSPTSMEAEPPVILDHSKPVEPMELLVEATGRPKYTEFDPTMLVFLTFPAFFGFMIGDLGYGLLYVGIGYALYTRDNGDAIRALGGVAIWAGAFTILFGILYGEVFGLHVLGDWLFAGHPPLHKGLQPHYDKFATLWLVTSLVVGLGHVTLGHVLGFAKTFLNHDPKHAVYENGSWILMTVGFWGWIFSRHLLDQKPRFLFELLGTPGAVVGGQEIAKEQVVFALGFTGLPESVGLAGLAAWVVGIVILAIGEGPMVAEFLQAVVNVLSYVRLMAVLLAKAGLAFVVNLLTFGAYEHKGEFHFLFVEGETPSHIASEYGAEAIMFPGMFNLGDGALLVIGFLAGVVILVVGHLFVLALGVTSAGLQGIRLEYVEFFGKFYDGGGRSYNPFGYSREYTTED